MLAVTWNMDTLIQQCCFVVMPLIISSLYVEKTSISSQDFLGAQLHNTSIFFLIL